MARRPVPRSTTSCNINHLERQAGLQGALSLFSNFARESSSTMSDDHLCSAITHDHRQQPGQLYSTLPSHPRFAGSGNFVSIRHWRTPVPATSVTGSPLHYPRPATVITKLFTVRPSSSRMRSVFGPYREVCEPIPGCVTYRALLSTVDQNLAAIISGAIALPALNLQIPRGHH